MNINENQKPVYYVYRHIRTDKNEPFYIGKGTVDTDARGEKTQYWRAYDKSGRTDFWKRVISKTSYEVEILFQSEDLKLILDKESEFIKIYGRRDLGLGPLVNLTDGGEGNPGRQSPPNIVRVFAYKIDGTFYKEYKSFTDCAKDLDLNPKAVSEIANRKDEPGKKPRQKSSGGFMFFLDFLGNQAKEMKKNTESRRSVTPVFSYLRTGEFFKKYSSSVEAAKDIGVLRKTITSAIRINESSEKFLHVKDLILFNTYKGEKVERILPKSKILIVQYDENLNYIKEFPSSTSAGELLGINRRTIVKYLKSGLPFNGFIFKSN